MKLKNNGSTTLLISDIIVNGYPLEFDPGEEMTLYDEDVERSAQIKAFVDSAVLQVTGEAEPNEGIERPIVDDTNKITTFVYNMAISSPQRPTTAYSYLFNLTDGGSLAGSMSGGASTKTYAIGVSVNRSATTAATGDSNDAVLRGSYNNYAANDTNFIMRGINVSLANRSGGRAIMDNLLGCQGKSGGTCGSITGLTVVPENYGTVSDLFGGVDVVMKNEGAVATTEFGVRIRNLNNSLATKVGSAIKIEQTGANLGYTVGLNMAGANVTTGIDLTGATITNEMILSTGATMTASGDTITFTRGAKTFVITMA